MEFLLISIMWSVFFGLVLDFYLDCCWLVVNIMVRVFWLKLLGCFVCLGLIWKCVKVLSIWWSFVVLGDNNKLIFLMIKWILVWWVWNLCVILVVMWIVVFSCVWDFIWFMFLFVNVVRLIVIIMRWWVVVCCLVMINVWWWVVWV